jgi:2-polyprenyl-3-methyl-5-hydroxy-6-metoxy-1,4-benzoquinol methylase
MAVSKYDITLDLAKHPGTSRAFLVTMVGANKRVLDIGCDTGYLGEELAAFGNVTSGFEYNATAAEVARTVYERVEVGDLEAVDLAAAFDGAKFDVVVFGDVLEHLRDPLPVLRRARSMLTPGGCVLISVPNVAHGDIRLNLLRGQFRYTKIGLLDETHTRFFTKDSLIEFIQDAGFTMIEMRRTRKALFKTEVGVKEDDFDAELVATLSQDPEATTYQFVVRAVPDDAVQVTSEQAVLVDELTNQLNEQRRLVRELKAREVALSARVFELSGPASGKSAQRSGRSLAGRIRRRLGGSAT